MGRIFKKGGHLLLVTMLTFSMIISYLGIVPVSAKEPSDQTTLKDSDYVDTTLKRSKDSLTVARDAVTDLKKFNKTPLYDMDNNELLLPRLEGYKVEIFGSDNKATISLKGEVTRPLVTQKVKLLYKLTNLQDKTVVTTETNAVVTIPGQELTVTGNNTKPKVIPELREWAGGTGKVNLSDARIVLGSSQFSKAANTFKADYKALTGRNIELISGNKDILKAGDIFFNLVDDKMLGDEGYYMNVGGEDATANYIEIKATHNTGALYGGITILQILKQDSGRDEISKGLVKDYPLFEQRGMMIDVARKWIPMEYLNDLTKQMSWYKLNMISLHLSDNDIWNGLSTENGRGGQPEGWFRLESEKFPELNQNSDGYDKREYYTKEEFRNYQRDSMNLGIDVIPELDTPGHALAYTRAWPGTQRPDNQKYLDASSPEVLEKVKALFSEYITGYNGGEPTFIGPHVNIGTDEYKSGTASDKEAFRKYCDALLKHVKSLGKEAVFWGSLTENSGSTEVTTDATMFAWFRGYANAKQSLDAGYKIISMEDSEVYIVPGGGYYSNQFGQAESLYNNWMPNNNYGWAGNPAPDAHPGVMGGQFAVWNDFNGNGISVQDISYRIQHNMYVIAEKCWAGSQAKTAGNSFGDIKALAKALGDAPNTDFLYEIKTSVEDNELLKLDDDFTNKVAKNTGATLKDHSGVDAGVTGKNGNGLKFNGGSSYIETDIKSPGFGWTTSMWINPENDGILMEGKTGTLRLKNGKIQYNVEQYTHEFAATINNGQWTHITLTGTYEGVKLYVNGQLSESLIGKPIPNWNPNSGCNSYDGTDLTVDGKRVKRYFETLMLPMETIGSKNSAVTASIDELHIYNKILSDKEIAKLAGETPTVEYENLALNKTVTASGDETANFSHDKVVDGDVQNTRWSSNYDDNAWLEVDLGKEENVNNIKIYWEAAYGVQYKILVAGSDKNYTEVFNETAGRGGIKDIKFDMKSVQYIKFQGVERNPASDGKKYGFSFYELEAYGDKIKGSQDDYERQNVALNKNVEVGNYHSASTEGDRSGSNAVDGNSETRWEFDLNQTGANWIQIPLADNEDVDKIILKQMVWGGANRISKVEIKKVDGSTETTLKTIDSFDGGTIDSGNKIATATITLDSVVKADAIKIYITPKAAGADDLVNIREIELYGTKTVPEEVGEYSLIPHSSMEASATDEHPNYGNYEGPARFAIDDNQGTYWHTNWNEAKGLPQSITLSLKEMQYIGKYSYLPRQTGTGGFITKYKLEVSLDNVNFTKVAEGNCAENSQEKVIEFTPVFAKYVRLTALEGKQNHASAAELNISKVNVMTKQVLQTMFDKASELKDGHFVASSKDTLASAIDEVKEVLAGNPSDTEIANAYERLINGVKALVTGGDISELVEFYEANKDLQAEEYAKDGYNKYVTVKEKVKRIIDSGDAYSQKEIDNAKKELENAILNLASLSQLKDWITVAEAIDSLDATETTRNELKLRLDNVKKLLSNDAATANQVQVALYHLGLAIDDLVPDPTALETLINSYNVTDYTHSSWTVFLPFLDEARTVLASSPTLEQLTNTRTLLMLKASQLVTNASVESLTLLTDLVNKADQLDSKDYEKTSWQEYMKLINKAKELLDHANDITQPEVDKIVNDIRSYNLILNVDLNKPVLEKAIKDYESRENTYTVSSWKVFKKYLNQAKDVLTGDDNDKIVNMINTLHEESKKLVLRGNVSNLANLVKQYNVHEGTYTAKSYQNYMKHLTVANQAIKDNSDLSQKDIDEMTTNLKKAFKDLVKVEVPVVKPVPNPDQDGTKNPDSNSGTNTGDTSSYGIFLLVGTLSLVAALYLKTKRKED